MAPGRYIISWPFRTCGALRHANLCFNAPYLAEQTYETIFQTKTGQLFLEDNLVRLIVFNAENEVITQWIPDWIIVRRLNKFCVITLNFTDKAAWTYALYLIDDTQKSYLLLKNGWEGNKYIHHAPIHLEIINGKIWIQNDDTEEGIADDLLEAGVPKKQIILGFKPPSSVRPYTEFAAT